MVLKWLKILLTGSLGLLCLFYALQNIANLDAVYSVMAAVMGMENHNYYPTTFAFTISQPTLIWLAAALVIAAELTAGLVFLVAGWKLIQVRNAPSNLFQAEKSWVLIGAGIALLVWFGFFQVIGGAFFQMWQTELGDASMRGAFIYLASVALVTWFVYQPEPT
ncbi:DUF2165 domain-containing protein [Pseudidiomarina homiensis]|uniref:DUF2165 domain-containing protein n=1 Tax=Pseudidiomarina homiensis TaxID=364198 RepID=UPI00215A524A|nr:DUF2165 domain-containing protein [Pseudidiomarina homiensis]